MMWIDLKRTELVSTHHLGAWARKFGLLFRGTQLASFEAGVFCS
jgi:hypothetical protein